MPPRKRRQRSPSPTPSKSAEPSATQPSVSTTQQMFHAFTQMKLFEQRLKNYHGNDEEKPEDFLKHLDNYFSIYNFPDDQRLEIVTSCLKDSAADWWKPRKVIINSYDDFKRELLKEYSGTQRLELIRAKVLTVAQKKGDSVVDFLNLKVKMLRRFDNTSDESETCKSIIKLIEPGLQCHLRTRNPSTLVDLVLEADEYEKLIKQDREQQQRKSNPNTSSNNSSAFNVKPTSRTERKESPSTSDFPLPKCYYCPQRHFHKDCPVAREKFNWRNRNSGNDNAVDVKAEPKTAGTE